MNKLARTGKGARVTHPGKFIPLFAAQIFEVCCSPRPVRKEYNVTTLKKSC